MSFRKKFATVIFLFRIFSLALNVSQTHGKSAIKSNEVSLRASTVAHFRCSLDMIMSIP